jgi:hypothetical protein
MQAQQESLYFDTSSINIKKKKFASFKQLIPLKSTTSNTELLDRYDICTFLWNLEAFQAIKPAQQRNDDNSWTMFIHCPNCADQQHPESLFTLHITPESFTLLIHAWCPHQHWIIKTRDDIKGGKLRLTSLDTRIQKTFESDHPFRVFGKFLLKHYTGNWHPGEEDFLKANCLSQSTQFAVRSLQNHTESLDALVHNTPGYWTISVKDADSNSQLLFNQREVVQITWIHPKALDVLAKSQYIQLDASFEALRPYIYSIPLGMLHNNAVPLGLQLSPTEREDHYSCFFDQLTHLIDELDVPGNISSITNQPILSDEGTALKAFCESRNFIQFHCYRHLLESFGSSSFVGLIVQRLLFTSSLEEYEAELPQAFADLHEIDQRNQISIAQRNKLERLFNWTYDSSVMEFRPRDPENIDFAQALWNRSEYRVSTCSNHVERLHRTCNEAARTCLTLVHRLQQVIKVINEKFARVRTNPNFQAKEKFKSLRAKAKDIHLPASSQCTRAACHWGEIYSKRFGIDSFPCLHRVLSVTLEELHFPIIPTFSDSIQESHIDLQEAPIDWAFRTAHLTRTHLEPLSETEEVAETIQNPLAVPTWKNSHRFLLQLSHELLTLDNIDIALFDSQLIEVSSRWTLFLRENALDEDDIFVRARFRLGMWSHSQFL